MALTLDKKPEALQLILACSSNIAPNFLSHGTKRETAFRVIENLFVRFKKNTVDCIQCFNFNPFLLDTITDSIDENWFRNRILIPIESESYGRWKICQSYDVLDFETVYSYAVSLSVSFFKIFWIATSLEIVMPSLDHRWITMLNRIVYILITFYVACVSKFLEAFLRYIRKPARVR